MEQQARRLAVAFIASFVAVFFFAWLAREVWSGAALPFDMAMRGMVHRWASPPLTRAMRAITLLGASAFLIPLVLVLVWRLVEAGWRRAAVALVAAAAGAEALDELLKLAFQRPRPVPFFGYTEPLTYSFPSGHAMVSACFYGTAAAILAARTRSRAGKAGIWMCAGLLTLAIGLSRIYLGVHYPTDILGGYAAGAVWIAAVRAGYALWGQRRRSTA